MEIDGKRRHLLSGELAVMTGVSTDTLRHYEKMLVLPRPQRSSGGYRMYPPEAADRVRLVRRAMTLGFSLEELSKILMVRDRGGSPCRQVQALAVRKLAELDKQIEDLVALRGQMKTIVAQWQTQLNGTPHGQPARLLETLILPPSGEDQSK